MAASMSPMRSIQRGRRPALRYASIERWVWAARLDSGLPLPVCSSRSRPTIRSTGERRSSSC